MGSEMCIRDSLDASAADLERARSLAEEHGLMGNHMVTKALDTAGAELEKARG